MESSMKYSHRLISKPCLRDFMSRDELIRKYAKLYGIPRIALELATIGKRNIKPIARKMSINLMNEDEKVRNREREKNFDF